MPRPDPKLSLIVLAMTGAAFTMAYQVAGKAARDAYFLSYFGARHLPAVVMAAAVAAIVLGIVSGRLLGRFGPGRLIPTFMLVSAVLQGIEWFLLPAIPRVTSVAIYIHIVALGAVITSGFWSVINEQLDPYSAKRNFGRIAACGTGGGVAGGFAAERIAAWMAPGAVLLFLAAAQFITAILLWSMPRVEHYSERSPVRAIDILRRSTYHRNLTYLVILGTFAAALLDYVLKAEARHTLGPGEPLLRFFALFHTGAALLSFLAQTLVTPGILNRWGLGMSITILPACVTGGGLIAVLTGGFPAIILARGVEAVLRGSIFRAAYELLYAPMLPAEKRALKSVNDVTFDRVGDGLGGGFSQLVISTVGAGSEPLLVGAAAVASGAGWMVARRLNAAYVGSLERNLRHRAVELDLADDHPPVEALAEGKLPDRGQVPYIVPLLGRKSGSASARRVLEAVAYDNTGQLSDYLLDVSTLVTIRIQLPRILAAGGNRRAFDALLRGLDDEDAEVRAECGRALPLLRRTTGIDPDQERVYEAVRRELNAPDDLAHVFALLGSVLPSQPVRIAFEALSTGDDSLRGLALEYLESALPADIGRLLLPVVEKGVANSPAKATITRPAEAIRDELLSVTGMTASSRERME